MDFFQEIVYNGKLSNDQQLFVFELLDKSRNKFSDTRCDAFLKYGLRSHSFGSESIQESTATDLRINSEVIKHIVLKTALDTCA